MLYKLSDGSGLLFEVYRSEEQLVSTNAASHSETSLITVASDNNIRVYEYRAGSGSVTEGYYYSFRSFHSGHAGDVLSIAHFHPQHEDNPSWSEAWYRKDNRMWDWYCTGSQDETVRIFNRHHDFVTKIDTLFTIAVSFPHRRYEDGHEMCRIVTMCIGRLIRSFDVELAPECDPILINRPRNASTVVEHKLKKHRAGDSTIDSFVTITSGGVVPSGFKEFACGLAHSPDGKALVVTGDQAGAARGQRSQIIRIFDTEAIAFTWKHQLSVPHGSDAAANYYWIPTALLQTILFKGGEKNQRIWMEQHIR